MTYTYRDDISPVLSQNCGTCHSWHTAYINLVGPVSVYAPTTGLPIVNPSRPDSSVLIWRLEGALPGGGAIGRMPQFGSALPAETVQMFREWIAMDAPDVLVQVKTTSWGDVKTLFR